MPGRYSLPGRFLVSAVITSSRSRAAVPLCRYSMDVIPAHRAGRHVESDIISEYAMN